MSDWKKTENQGTVRTAVGVALLVLLVVGVWGYWNLRPEPAVAGRRDIVATVALNGEVIAPPSARADVRAPYDAPVERVLTTVGARVKRGDVLVELSHASAQAAYEQARAGVRAAETEYANARRGYDEPVVAARQRLEEARAAEQRAAAVAVRTEATPDGEVFSVEAPTTEILNARETRIQAEVALDQAQAARDAGLLPYWQRLQAARAAFRDAQAGRRTAMVRAPIGGTVLALNAQPGEGVGPDRDPVATIVDLEGLQVLADVKPDDVSSVKAGRPVTVTVKELPGERFDGRVRSVTTEPARPLLGPRYVAVIGLENRRGLVKPDLKAHAVVDAGEAEDVVAVPTDAIVWDEGQPTVRAWRNERWETVPVTLGLSDGRFTEVRSGLEEGQTVQRRARPLRLFS